MRRGRTTWAQCTWKVAESRRTMRRRCGGFVSRQIRASRVMLGYLYYSGQGVPQDYSQALSCYRTAAEHGVVVALVALMEVYSAGLLGLKKGEVEALKWCLLATKRGSPDGPQATWTLEQRMTGRQIEQALALAKAWADQYWQTMELLMMPMSPP